jgi:hypothetical protein
MSRRVPRTMIRLGLLVSPLFTTGHGVAVPLRLTIATTARDAERLRSRPSHSRGFHRLAALGLGCLLAFSATQADAEVAVDGDRDQMQVTADNDTVDQVLEALGQTGNLHYSSSLPLTKVIGGSFSGSLGHVLSRVLVGFDFVVHYNPQGVELFVYGESGATSVPPPREDPSVPRPRPGSRVAGRAVGLNLAPRPDAPHAPNQ